MSVVNTTKEEFKNEDIRKSVAKLISMLDLDPDSKTLFHFKDNPELDIVRIPIEKELNPVIHTDVVPMDRNEHKCAVFEIRYDYDRFLGYQFTGWHFKEITNI